MKPLPETPELLAVAERVVWFKPPAETLADPVHFLAHVMTYGTVEDLRALDGVAGPDEFREAPDKRTSRRLRRAIWAYWSLKCGRPSVPPLPLRRGLV